jgi:hypothetical protein
MLGAVGEDAHGAAMLASLALARVDTAAIAHVPGPTGLAYVFVGEDGENQIVIVPGANGALRAPASLPPGTTMALAQAEVAPDEVAAFLALARKAGATTLYNAAPATDEARAALALADIVVVNETELAFFLGEPEPPQGDAAVARAATRPGLPCRAMGNRDAGRRRGSGPWPRRHDPPARAARAGGRYDRGGRHLLRGSRRASGTRGHDARSTGLCRGRRRAGGAARGRGSGDANAG